MGSSTCSISTPLGALVEREVIDNGETRKSLTLPDEWATRLADAVYRSAFETMSAGVIAEPLPARRRRMICVSLRSASL